jgi:hypothetical protein
VSEQDLRDCMKQAVWDEPPLDFDPDSFMARAEQLTRRRRALMSVGVATALIIATVATVPALFVSGRNRVDTANSVTATATSAPTPADLPWPPSDANRRNHRYEEDQPELETMWVNVLSPALQREGAEVGSIGPWSPIYQPMAFQRDGSFSDVLSGTVSYVGPNGPAQLTITIAGVGSWEPSPAKLCTMIKANNTTCESIKRPDGSAVVTMEVASNKSGSASGYYSGERSVYHYRLDGSVVVMTSRPQFTGSNTYETDQLPLAFSQLTDLATNQGIKLPG